MSGAGMRWQVCAEQPIRYEVRSVPGLFAADNATLLEYGAGRRRFVVLDAAVDHWHGAAIRDWFMRQQIEARIVTMHCGEARKNTETWLDLARRLDTFPLRRRDEPILAIGGGVLTDVAAFVAASYRRGLPHIKIPTTLMGYIDAALGIKNGINFNGQKNRLGSFTPPQAVLLDVSLLASLPRRHLLNGMGEIIKLALVCDGDLFGQLERHAPQAMACAFGNRQGQAILDRAIDGMLAQLTPDLHEQELRRKVDFGHTFSYGLEARHPERLLHGEAVLLDCLASCLLARRRGLLDAAELDRVFALVTALGFRLDTGTLDAGLMWAALQDRTLHRNGHQHVPMPAGLGRCVFIEDIRRPELAAVLPELQRRLEPVHASALEC